jgi:hypothetical protein
MQQHGTTVKIKRNIDYLERRWQIDKSLIQEVILML